VVTPATVLDSIADTIEALVTTTYKWATTDAWRRGRTLDPTRQGDRHLEFWLAFDRGTLGPRDRLEWDLVITVSVRLTPRNDYADVGRAHLAALAAVNALDRWTNSGARCSGLAYTLTAQPGGEWGTIEIAGTVLVTDWR